MTEQDWKQAMTVMESAKQHDASSGYTGSLDNFDFDRAAQLSKYNFCNCN